MMQQMDLLLKVMQDSFSKADDWFVQQHKHNETQNWLLTQQFVSGMPAELRYFERSGFLKDVKVQKWRKFEVSVRIKFMFLYTTILDFKMENGNFFNCLTNI